MRHSHNKSLIRKCSWVCCHESLPSICGAAGASTTDSHYYPIKAAGARLSCTCHLPTARLSAALPGSGRKRVKLDLEVPPQHCNAGVLRKTLWLDFSLRGYFCECKLRCVVVWDFEEGTASSIVYILDSGVFHSPSIPLLSLPGSYSGQNKQMSTFFFIGGSVLLGLIHTGNFIMSKPMITPDSKYSNYFPKYFVS